MEEQEPVLQTMLEKYDIEIGKVVKIDAFNMKDIQMDLPSKRHYWVGRLMYHKTQLANLTKQRKKAVKLVHKQLKEESPVGLSVKNLNESADNHELVRKIDDRIVEEEILIDYLTKIEANFRDMSFSIKNLIEIMKLETT